MRSAKSAMAAEYDLTTPDADGWCVAKRRRDGLAARVRHAWFRAVEGGYVPASRVKALRLELEDWQ